MIRFQKFITCYKGKDRDKEPNTPRKTPKHSDTPKNTVCSDLSVRKLRIITVLSFLDFQLF